MITYFPISKLGKRMHNIIFKLPIHASTFILLLEGPGGSTLAWMWHVSRICSVSFPSSWLTTCILRVADCLNRSFQWWKISVEVDRPSVAQVCVWCCLFVGEATVTESGDRWQLSHILHFSQPNLKFNVQRLNKEVFRNLALVATWSIVSSQLHISVLWWTHPELLLRQVMILPHKRNSQQPASKLFESISHSLRLYRVSGWHPSSFRWLLCQ